MVVDDHPAFRKGIIVLLESEPDLRVVAQAGDGCQAVEIYRQKRPDLVLMDLRLPGMSGVEATIFIRNEFPDARVIVLTSFDMDEDIFRAIQAGAKSYLLKDQPEHELVETIRAVHAGQEILSGEIVARLAARRRRGNFTSREMEVLHLLAKSRSNKEISDSLFIPANTVKGYLKALFNKLNAKDRTGAVVSAIRHGIVHLE